LEICRILLEAGADPNPRQHEGFTPLLEAAQHGNADLVELLLEHVADASATLADGRTAAELAAGAGASELAARLGG
jgi:ankyrin repeat protein